MHELLDVDSFEQLTRSVAFQVFLFIKVIQISFLFASFVLEHALDDALLLFLFSSSYSKWYKGNRGDLHP